MTPTAYKKEKTICRPCLAALEAKEQGTTFQLNTRRESLPPLHQNIPNPLAAFDEGLDSGSEDLTLFRPIPCFEDARDELITT